jgi:hypothetical protein
MPAVGVVYFQKSILPKGDPSQIDVSELEVFDRRSWWCVNDLLW